MIQNVTCPRRVGEWGPWKRAEGLDRFDSKHPEAPEVLNCSFCGSLDPETVLVWMCTGATITPTDKTYKLYIEKSGFGTKKFYFQHFNKSHQLEFINLYNSKKRTFNIAYPGYFYVVPYFCKVHEGQS